MHVYVPVYMHAHGIFDDCIEFNDEECEPLQGSQDLQKHFLSEKKDNSSPSFLRQICVDPGGNVKRKKRHEIKGRFHYVSLIKMHRRDVV